MIFSINRKIFQLHDWKILTSSNFTTNWKWKWLNHIRHGRKTVAGKKTRGVGFQRSVNRRKDPRKSSNRLNTSLGRKIDFRAILKKVQHLVSQGIYTQNWKISCILYKPRWCWEIRRRLGSLIYFVRPCWNTKNISIFSYLRAKHEILFGHKVNSCFYVKILEILNSLQ